jgi:hypothetical protein
MSEKKYPVAKAGLARDRDVWLWIVNPCPLCGRKHTHGGGSLDGDPRRLLGHRVAHCTEKEEPGGYVLVEKTR